jgi:ABC-type transport system involved in multi-copper enzyme maturation permease subunit
MLGPVLYLEMLLGGRRGRQFVFRWLYAGWLVVQLLVCYALYRIDFRTSSMIGGEFYPDASATGRFASGFVELFIIQQFILVLLATPAFTAGAITDEKTRGTLEHLLTAHLTAGEIVLGKLLGRLAQVAVLVLAGLPVLCFVGVFGGLEPSLMLTVLAATAAPLFALGAASVLASVWSRQTRDAVVVLYAVGAGLALLFWGVPQIAALLLKRLPPGSAPGTWTNLVLGMNQLLRAFNPLLVVEPAWTTGDMHEVGTRLLRLILAWTSVGVACLLLATWRLRSAFLRQLENNGRKRRVTETSRPPLSADNEPILWRERYIAGLAPLPSMREVSTPLAVVLIVLFTVVLSGSLLVWSVPGAGVTQWADLWRLPRLVDTKASSTAFLVQALGAMLIFTLVVGIRCSGAVSGEREKQTWEALLLTPLETRTLVRDKLWAVLYASLPYFIAYAVPALFLSLWGGFLAFVWTLVGLAVTLLNMFYVGAAGIYCSVSCRSSWRSLMGTLGIGYLIGFLFFVFSPVVGFIVGWLILMILKIAEAIHGGSLQIALAGLGELEFALTIGSAVALLGFFFMAAQWMLLPWAEQWIASRERTRHWKTEPLRALRRLPALPVAENRASRSNY